MIHFSHSGLIVCPCSATLVLLRATLPLMVLSADLKRCDVGRHKSQAPSPGGTAGGPVGNWWGVELSLKQQRINVSARRCRAEPQGRLQQQGRVIIQDGGGARQEADTGRLGREKRLGAWTQQPTLMRLHVLTGKGRMQTIALTGLFDIWRSANCSRSGLWNQWELWGNTNLLH